MFHVMAETDSLDRESTARPPRQLLMLFYEHLVFHLFFFLVVYSSQAMTSPV